MTIKLVAMLIMVSILVSPEQDKFFDIREEMVEIQIQNRGISNRAVLQAMRKVQRHEFVPESYKNRAYFDGALPIGYGQTISQPYIVAYMTNMLQLASTHTVLEIGTGSGYQAAVLAEIVDKVYTIEIIPELGERAINRLAKLKYNNVEVRISDGYYGWTEHAPYDAIIVTAASETIPNPLIRQLKDGGRMAIPVGSPFLTQYLLLITKKGDKITTKNVLPVRFVPFTRSGNNNDK